MPSSCPNDFRQGGDDIHFRLVVVGRVTSTGTSRCSASLGLNSPTLPQWLRSQHMSLGLLPFTQLKAPNGCVAFVEAGAEEERPRVAE
jgi:hypothetical protein